MYKKISQNLIKDYYLQIIKDRQVREVKSKIKNINQDLHYQEEVEKAIVIIKTFL